MLNKKIILALVIFALVPARTKIYGQIPKDKKARINRREEVVDGFLLKNGLDSVLKAHALDSDRVKIIFDEMDSAMLMDYSSEITGYFFGHNNSHISTYMYVDHFSGFDKKTLSGIPVEGIHSIAASGRIIYKDSFNKTEWFFFTKTEEHFYECSISNPVEEKPSFWNSTAIPILVTLGAVAVIALFFLVRG